METSELNVKLDCYGDVDVAYYVREANKARSAYVLGLIPNVIAKIKQLRSKRQSKSFNSTRSFGTI